MKRKLTAILAVFLAALILCGSTSPTDLLQRGIEKVGAVYVEETEADYQEYEVRFDDMRYERPDPAAFHTLAERLFAILESEGGYRQTIALLDELFTLYYSASTMMTLADIHSCQDLTDAFWAEEYSACFSATTEISQVMEDVYLACGASPYGERLERDYFGEGFMAEYGEDAESMLSEKYVRLLEQENELIAEYRELVAEPVIMLDGKDQPFYDALNDTRTQEEINAVYHAYYDKYNPLVGDLYLRQIEVRKAQAAELGYDSYAEMMYDIGFDRDFTIADGHAFVESVKKWILPVYERCMDFAHQDALLESYIEEEDLCRVLEAVARGLGGEVKQAHDFMLRNGLYDLAMSGKKANMSFQTYLDSYDAPFLFANPFGDMEDIITVTHEFGHYVEAYISYGAYRSMDLAEVFSQAMQFLALNQLGSVLGPEGVEDMRLLNCYDILSTLVWQSAYAEFEERAYAMQEPTVEKLNALMDEIGREYGLNDSEDPDFGCSWIDITHFIEQPFYVISYPVSACCALEIYERELADSTGLAEYLRLVESEEIGLVGAAEEAGLQNPVTDARVQAVASFLENLLAA